MFSRSTVASPWFFRGGRHYQLKPITRPPHGVRGAKVTRSVAKFHFSKRFKLLKNEAICQKYQYFSCPKHLFLRKYSKTWTCLKWIHDVFGKNIWKFSDFMKPINPEKLWGNSVIRFRYLQWPRKEFFQGNSRATKILWSVQRRVSGVRRPTGTVRSFIFQTNPSIWKGIHFSKMSTFFFPKRSIISKKNLGKLNIFFKNFWIFSKNYFKFSLFMISYKSREILCQFWYLIGKFMKNLKK